MNTTTQLKQDTSVMTMSHDTIHAMNRYEEAIRHAAAKHSCGLVNYNEALNYVRNYG